MVLPLSREFPSVSDQFLRTAGTTSVANAIGTMDALLFLDAARFSQAHVDSAAGVFRRSSPDRAEIAKLQEVLERHERSCPNAPSQAAFANLRKLSLELSASFSEQRGSDLSYENFFDATLSSSVHIFDAGLSGVADLMNATFDAGNVALDALEDAFSGRSPRPPGR